METGPLSWLCTQKRVTRLGSICQEDNICPISRACKIYVLGHERCRDSELPITIATMVGIPILYVSLVTWPRKFLLWLRRSGSFKTQYRTLAAPIAINGYSLRLKSNKEVVNAREWQFIPDKLDTSQMDLSIQRESQTLIGQRRIRVRFLALYS